MDTIGIPNSQGDTVLHKMPEKIRMVGQVCPMPVILYEGTRDLDRYTGPRYPITGGFVQYGDYIGYRRHVTLQWMLQHPTQWQTIR